MPAAKFRVRFLISELLKGRDPARDFFHLLGLPEDTYRFEEEARNTSLDFALLHVLSKNPHLFTGIHDNRVRQGLRQALAKRFQTANIRMLSSEQEAKIEEFFREENLWLLKHYGEEIDVDEIYRRHFLAPKAGVRYSDVTEMDVIYRCLGIMLEAGAVRRDAELSEIIQMVGGIAKIPAADPRQRDHILGIALDGLRYHPSD